MDYIVCEEPGKFVLKNREEPTPLAGEALLKIQRVGICGTDLHAYAGNQAFFSYPRILGHELSAKVLAIEANDKGIKVGDAVVVMPYVHCGTCIACRQGKTNCCVSLKVLGIHTDGGMQQIISVSNDLLLPAQGLDYNQMALVEPLAIGAHAVRRCGISSGETAVVVGCGPIGLGLLKFLQAKGCRTIAIDANEDRLRFATDVLGVAKTIVADGNSKKAVSQWTDGALSPFVFDATGHRGALESGIHYMAHGGTYVLVGLSKGDLCFDHPTIHAKETSLLCSRNATMEDFQEVISLLSSGGFPADTFITHQVRYQDMIGRFDDWLDPANGVIKAMVDFS